ncbi:MAG TPA: adenosylcobinamide-GDP ribazoletransferase [Silvibacterium sp.]|nr:adenosylcobinamide-GDP ribazoletransferase [Silvibacterium sp.]
MTVLAHLRQGWFDFLSAVQFLTRIRVPAQPYEADTLSRSVKFFPVVGLLIGLGGALLHFLLAPHFPALIVALVIVIYFVLITGCMHEDGLADAADGFGGGWDREKVLAIMRDSRIGTYGATALALSLLARLLLIASLPATRAEVYLVAAHVLCRWTTLPLSFYLPPARDRGADQIDGQGARIARVTTRGGLIFGSLFTFVLVLAMLRIRGFIPVLAAASTTLVSGFYYRQRIGGVTGDCFGATNQLTEIAVYLCGVWT